MPLRWRKIARLGLICGLLALGQTAFAGTREPTGGPVATLAQMAQAPPAVGAAVLRMQVTPESSQVTPESATNTLTSYMQSARRLVKDTRLWLEDSYRRSPEAVIGLAILAVLPLLALPVGLLRLAGTLHRRMGKHHDPVDQPVHVADGLSTAWLDVVLSSGSATRLPLDRPMLRIGRHDENDICLPDASVQGYHALIYWSPEDAYQIRDLTASEDAGVRVNGQPIGAAPLRKGDLIELGDVRMLFATVHA